MKSFWLLLVFNIKGALRQPAGILQAPFLMLMGAALFPLSGNPQALLPHVPNIIWVLMLLASLIAQPYLLDNDTDDGSLEQIRLLPCGILPPVMAKLISFWLCYLLPLVIAGPVLAIWLGVNDGWKLTLPLFAGSIYISLLSFLIASLTVSAHKSPLLRALLMLPLYAPLVIFGAGGALMVLAGVTLVLAPLCIFLSVISLRSPGGI